MRRWWTSVLGSIACAAEVPAPGDETTEGATSSTTDAAEATEGASTSESTGAPACGIGAPDFATPPSSTLEGSSVVPVDAGLRFDLPEGWMSWYGRFANNLHLSRAELELVREGGGEWDTEYALVLERLLDFDRCAAHVGGEGWGLEAVSYGDLQVRAYRVPESPEEIVARAMTAEWKGIDHEVTVDETPPWTMVRISYDRSYGDYGGGANVELRMHRFGDATAVLAGMYTDAFGGDQELETLLATACWDSHAGECCLP